jgi:hypothetical protein
MHLSSGFALAASSFGLAALLPRAKFSSIFNPLQLPCVSFF